MTRLQKVSREIGNLGLTLIVVGIAGRVLGRFGGLLLMLIGAVSIICIVASWVARRAARRPEPAGTHSGDA